jgi:hypothetical protein
MKRWSIFIVTLLVSALFLSGCGSDSSSGGSSTLSFNKSSYQVKEGSQTEAVIAFTGYDSGEGATIEISSSNKAVATLSESRCTLANSSGGVSSCEIVIYGVSSGSATLSASAGSDRTTASVTVSNEVANGSLSFYPISEKLTDGSVRDVELVLSGSSGVSNLIVNISSTTGSARIESIEDLLFESIKVASSFIVTKAYAASSLGTSIDSITPSICVLSSKNNRCEIRLEGTGLGSATIKATVEGSRYSDYSVAENSVTVISDTIPGELLFEENLNITTGHTKSGKLMLKHSSGVSDMNITLSSSNSNVSLSTTKCEVSSRSPNCYFTVSGESAGKSTITASATGYSDAKMLVDVSSDPIPGTFRFSRSSETIDINDKFDLKLIYSGGSGVSGLDVTISSSDDTVVTATPGTCTMSNTHGASECEIELKGLKEGKSTITASATGYDSATSSIEVKSGGGTPVYGDIVFERGGSQVSHIEMGKNSSSTVELILENSSNVDSIDVSVASSDTTKATVSRSACTLSTKNNTCSIKVSSLSKTGSTTIRAGSSKHSYSAALAVAITESGKPHLSASQNPIVLPSNSKTASAVTITLENAPSSTEYVGIAAKGNIQNSPGFFNFTSSNNAQTLNVNTADTSKGASKSNSVTLTPKSSSIAPLVIPVNVETPKAVDRVFTVTNKCKYAVYPGIAGGGFGDGTNCPTGSTSFTNSSGDTQCWWDNPAPSTGSYKLDSGNSLTFTIPSTNSDSYNGQVFSGGLMGRIKDSSGNWVIGDCTGENNTTIDYCKRSKGFESPSTVAEFTLLRQGTDYYDITIINGITIPTVMKPSNVSHDTQTPYNNGAAGGTVDQKGSSYSLNAASWSFDPSATATPDEKYFNFVTESDTNCTASTSVCSSGEVCGYTDSNLTNKKLDSVFCGKRLGYVTAQEIWSKDNNVSTNNAPSAFKFTTSTGAITGLNTKYQYEGFFYGCPSPTAGDGFVSGFTGTYSGSKTLNARSCGCTDWSGIAHNSSPCVTYSDTWVNNVLPNTKWAKKGCPTCYTYQYDDKASTFKGLAPASSSNPVNGVNYDIIFCPDSKDFSNRPSYMQ